MKYFHFYISAVLFFYSCKETNEEIKKDPVNKFSGQKNVDSIVFTKPVIDSRYTFDEAINGKEIPESIKKNLSLLDIEYYSFDNKLHQGQILIHSDLSIDVEKIFKVIKENKFPIGKVIPIVKYNWLDSLSMKDNNTSAFNFRMVKGTAILSAHAKGYAIDINPMLNPQLKNGKSIPYNSNYDPNVPGTITENSIVVKIFKRLGWRWGGNWKRTKDYQHFEK